MNSRIFFLLSLVLCAGLQAQAAGPIESVMPPASKLGTGWERDTDLIMEDIADPPEMKGGGTGATMARQALALGLPLFKAANVTGLGNFAYNLSAPDSFTSLDANVSRFKSEADALAFWATKIPKEATAFAAGEEGALLDVQGTKVLYVREKNYSIKITALGDESKMKLLARLIVENIRKRSDD